jgi:hypothetical protein
VAEQRVERRKNSVWSRNGVGVVKEGEDRRSGPHIGGSLEKTGKRQWAKNSVAGKRWNS